jgi:hypothetical protein
MKLFIILFTIFAIVAFAAAQDSAKQDRIPDSETAVVRAEAVLIPVYIKKHIESERPFTATLKGDVWTVAGTLYCADGKPQSDKAPTCTGGVAVVQLSKSDAHVISMTHYK